MSSGNSRGSAMMDRLLDHARRIARYGAWVSGTLVLISAFMITLDVLLRKLLTVTLGGASEISSYVLATSTAWSLAFCLLDRAHIRIDSLYVLLPVRICACLDILALIAFAVFIGLMTGEAFLVFRQSAALWAHSLTPLAIPLAIPQAIWVLGLTFFFIVMMLLLVRAVLALIGGDVLAVHRLIGSRTAIQELPQQLAEGV